MTPDRIIAEARSWIGTPYRHQASLKGVGCDCLGLLRGVWRAVMGAEPETPPYAPDWAEAGAGNKKGRRSGPFCVGWGAQPQRRMRRITVSPRAFSRRITTVRQPMPRRRTTTSSSGTTRRRRATTSSPASRWITVRLPP
jgi:hypothetical protein